MENVTCCFTGHRSIDASKLEDVRGKLSETVTELIKKGCTRFAAGGALGFDTLAAQTVLSLREQYPSVTLHLVLPCRDQARLWKAAQIAEYCDILSKAQSVEYITESYTRWCMAQRNRRLVELSSTVVAYYDGMNKGGTAMTVGFAQKKGIEIINLF